MILRILLIKKITMLSGSLIYVRSLKVFYVYSESLISKRVVKSSYISLETICVCGCEC